MCEALETLGFVGIHFFREWAQELSQVLVAGYLSSLMVVFKSHVDQLLYIIVDCWL